MKDDDLNAEDLERKRNTRLWKAGNIAKEFAYTFKVRGRGGGRGAGGLRIQLQIKSWGAKRHYYSLWRWPPGFAVAMSYERSAEGGGGRRWRRVAPRKRTKRTAVCTRAAWRAQKQDAEKQKRQIEEMARPAQTHPRPALRSSALLTF